MGTVLCFAKFVLYSENQAVIKMDKSGSFHIKNIGKCSIFVNSKEVPSCKGINLSSDSLIEVHRYLLFHFPDLTLASSFTFCL